MARLAQVLRYVVVLLITLAVGAVGCIYLAPERSTAAAYGIERWRSGLVRKEMTLPDGSRIVYLEGGTGTPLVLLHGFGADKDNFTRVARYLTPAYRVLIPDLLGFGESDHPPGADYSPPAQAERVHAFAAALGATPLHVGGNSMGGQIALTYAALHRDEVRSLWLLAPAGLWTAPPSEIAETLRTTGRNPLLIRSTDEFAAMFDVVMADPPFLPRPMLDVIAQARIRNADLEERIFLQIVADSVEARARGLGTPALIVWGDRDRALNPASGELLRSLMARATLVMMPGIGHVPMIERPRETANTYLQWRRGLE
jgi:pimeloyl-ACP methyl ester carboxylesterase